MLLTDFLLIRWSHFFFGFSRNSQKQKIHHSKYFIHHCKAKENRTKFSRIQKFIYKISIKMNDGRFNWWKCLRFVAKCDLYQWVCFCNTRNCNVHFRQWQCTIGCVCTDVLWAYLNIDFNNVEVFTCKIYCSLETKRKATATATIKTTKCLSVCASKSITGFGEIEKKLKNGPNKSHPQK